MSALPDRWQGNLVELFLRCREKGVALWRSGDQLVFAPVKARAHTLPAASASSTQEHLDALKKRIGFRRQSLTPQNSHGFPAISPGIFGFFSYDFGKLVNGFDTKDSDALPLSDWGEYDFLLVQHAFRPGPIRIISSRGSVLPDWAELFAETIPINKPFRPVFRGSDPPAIWHKGFTAAKRAIKTGEVYQLNLARQFHGRPGSSPRALFAELWQREQAEHAAYFEGDGYAVLSASPELFMRLEKGIVTARPIKGTSRRSDSEPLDTDAKRRLIKSSKEQAELHMITDLMRNDLARFCRSGTVTVKRARAVQRLPGLFHTYAEITGEMKPGLSDLEAIVNSLPCGSISGCPKHAAIALIDRIEPRPRGIFCGTLGSFADTGVSIFSVLIRTIIWQPERVSYQAGGGLTIASERQAEFREITAKCRPAFLLGTD